MSIFKLKTITEVLDSAAKGSGLKKTLSVTDLFMLGLGAIIGTGIFVITGIAAVSLSGPAVVASYGLAGITAIFIALAYTEVATMIPSSGGAYSYTFVAFGEIFAWIVSWMLILYFLLSASTVAAGWSGYLIAMLKSGGIELPIELTKIPSEGGIINLPAVIISLLIASILIKGTKDSAILNTILVLIKIVAIGVFVFIAAPHFDTVHWFEHNHPFQSDLFLASPFMPFGVHGVVTGAALVFFAYNGFDALASAAEECKNPKRDLTIAILGSLVVCMTLYMVVSGLLVGIIPFHLIDQASSLPSALNYNGHSMISSIISAGVVIGMVSVILVQTFALSRIILTTARDGLLPAFLAKVHPKYNTPHITIMILGVIIALVSGFMPLTIIGTLSSVGSLSSFMMVCLVMMVLRSKYPDVKRPFKCPLVYLVGGFGVILCLVLLVSAMQKVGYYTVGWIIIGLVIYFTYYRYRKVQ
jgi:APA family basic amino acid/polyamine antiporter